MVFYASAVVLIGVALALAGAGFPRHGSGLPRFAAHLVWQNQNVCRSTIPR